MCIRDSDLIARQRPLAASAQERLLDADLGLLAAGELEVLLRSRQRDEIADRVDADRILAVEREVLDRFVHEAGAPAGTRQRGFETVPRYLVVGAIAVSYTHLTLPTSDLV